MSWLLFLFLAWAWPSEAECAFCPQMDCMNSIICGPGCFCLIPELEGTGRCFSND